MIFCMQPTDMWALRDIDRSFMINFEEELKNFKPSLEVEEAEQAIYNHELTDMTDVLQEMMQEMKRGI